MTRCGVPVHRNGYRLPFIGGHHSMRTANRTVGARLRIVLEPAVAIGPGKADLLQGIKETGSIAAAGRRMGMSYKRAWSMVETMHRCFRSPGGEAAKGGHFGGGAGRTALGGGGAAVYRAKGVVPGR